MDVMTQWWFMALLAGLLCLFLVLGLAMFVWIIVVLSRRRDDE